MLIAKLTRDVQLSSTKLVPYYEGFKGTYTEEGAVGVYKKVGDEFVVTELPPGEWTADYREWLEKELAEGRIKDFVDTSTDQDINIRIKGIEEAALIKSLTVKIKTTNMHAFDEKGVITKYATLNDIMTAFWRVRLELYETRRQHQIKALEEQLPLHTNVVRFIVSQCEDVQVPNLRRKTRVECDSLLEQHGYTPLKGGYDYIMRLPVSSFTKEVSDKHVAEMETIRAEIARLQGTNAERLWLADLQTLG
jgi:DNA topoisomerase-2